jgi:hypothetical protein
LQDLGRAQNDNDEVENQLLYAYKPQEHYTLADIVVVVQ